MVGGVMEESCMAPRQQGERGQEADKKSPSEAPLQWLTASHSVQLQFLPPPDNTIKLWVYQ